METSSGIQFKVLGPLRIERDGVEVELNAPMQRRLLLELLVNANTAVSIDALEESLWPGGEGGKARALRFHVSKLRDAVDPGRVGIIATLGNRYELRIDPMQIDASRFVAAVDRAQGLVSTKPDEAIAILDEALGWWRGNPYEEADSIDLTPEITRLKDAQLRAIEHRLEAMLEVGRHDEVVEELDVLVAQHPLRERLRGQQMLALYRSGRTAEALRAYEAARQTLGEELGIEPSPALAELEERILFGEAELLHTPVETPTINTVPAPSTRMIGRSGDLAALETLTAGSRIVTLIGIGGVGKTRLAQAFALDSPHGHEAVWWIQLAGARSETDVFDEVAGAIRAPVGGHHTALEATIAYLRIRKALLVLDNCEHVVDGVATLVSEVCDAAPAVSFIATSRVPLRVNGEALYRVPRLRTRPPREGDTGALSDAARYIIESAKLRGVAIDEANYPTISSIAERLEGVPLALELAVARLSTLEPDELDRRLGASLDVLGSRPGREGGFQDMASTIDWSVGLLGEDAKLLFSRISVFRGGADLRAIEAVCSDDQLAAGSIVKGLEELIGASLLEKTSDMGAVRFEMLDAVCDVAHTHLLESSTDVVQRRHATYFADLAENIGERLILADQARHLNEAALEEENLRVALAWAQIHDIEVASRIASGMGEYLFRRGRLREAERILTETAALPRVAESSALVGLFGTLGQVEVATGALQSAKESVERQRDLADRLELFTESLRADMTSSTILWSEGSPEAAIERLGGALDELGPRSDPLSVYMLRRLGRWMTQVSRLERVMALLAHLRWWSDQKHPFATAAVHELSAGLSLFSRDYGDAQLQLNAAAETYRSLDANVELAEVLNQASNVALARSDQDLSTRLAIEALQLATESQARGVQSQSLSMIGWALLRSGRPDVARRNLTRAVELALAAPAMVELTWAVSFMAAYQSVVGAADRAALLYSAADELERRALASGYGIPPNLEDYRREDRERVRSRLSAAEFEEYEMWGKFGELEELLVLVAS